MLFIATSAIPACWLDRVRRCYAEWAINLGWIRIFREKANMRPWLNCHSHYVRDVSHSLAHLPAPSLNLSGMGTHWMWPDQNNGITCGEQDPKDRQMQAHNYNMFLKFYIIPTVLYAVLCWFSCMMIFITHIFSTTHWESLGWTWAMY